MNDHCLAITNTNPVSRAGALIRNVTPSNSHVQRILRSAALSAALLLMAIPAALAAPQPDQVARERHACAVVLRLQPSVAGYDACIRSLDQSLDQAQLSAQKGNEARWRSERRNPRPAPMWGSARPIPASPSAPLTFTPPPSDEETRDPGD